MLAVLVVLVPLAGPALGQLEDRTPTGGANITTRKCIGGTNAGDRCNENSDCDSNSCFDYNIVDLTLNFRTAAGAGWTPTAPQMTTIRGYFDDINDSIYDITDGQMVIGTVALVVDNGAPNAVVQVLAGICGDGSFCVDDSDCTGACSRGGGVTNTGGWGANGQITLGTGCLDNPLCFAHEFMHLIANVRDEYEGALDDGVDNDGDGTIDECNENQSGLRCFGGTNNGQPCANDTNCPGTGGDCRRITCIDPGPPDSPTSVVGCLMRCCLGNTDSDLCWSGNHDPNLDTEQSQCRSNNDCWTQFGEEWPSVIQVPAGAPASGPTTAPTAVGFIEPSVLDRFVTVIDRSGSMDGESPRRIDVSITAVNDFIDLLSDGADFGLASFASADGSPDPAGVDSTKDFPPEAGLRALDDAADRSDAQTAVSGLSTRTGGFTRMGAGLREARDMLLEDGGAVTLNTTVLFLTDGLNNRPTGSAEADLDAALQELADDSIPVFVTCIGEGRDSAQCSNIADKTAGRFVDSAETDSLFDAFVEFAAAAQGNEIACSEIGTPIADGETSASIPALVEDGVLEVRFVVSWTQSSSDLDLRLFRPNGAQVPEGSKLLASQGESYLIANPEGGIWMMQVFGASVPASEKFSARAIVDHPELTAPTGLTKSNVEWPDGFHLAANPTMGLSIVDCVVTAVAELPDGTVKAFELVDDGSGVDAEQENGIYEAEFRDLTAGDGIYTFTVTVMCDESTAGFHVHQDPGVGTLPGTPDVPTFERVIRFSGTITGVPANLPPNADICMDVNTECQGETTAVDLDGGCSSDPDGDDLTYAWSSPTGTFPEPNAVMTTGLFPFGFNDVTLTVTDPDGASDSDEGLVVVADTVPPTMACPDSLLVFGANCRGFEDVPVEEANAMDVCELVSVESSPATVDCFDTQTATLTATDIGGNQNSCNIDVSVECRDPKTQGYWYRQCLGADLIDPGRHGQGRGPMEPLEPEFTKELVLVVDGILQDKVFLFETCADGMRAEPPSDPCQRALKQYTSMLLNLAANRIHNTCNIDISNHECSSTNVFDLVDELAGLINSADPNSCKQADRCAGAVNEKRALEAIVLDATILGAATNVAPETDEEAAAVLSGGPSSLVRGATPQPATSADEAPAPDSAPSIVVVDPATAGSLEPSVTPADAAKQQPAEPEDDRRRIDRQLTVLGSSSATEEDRLEAQDALLTALSGGYEPALRLRIVKTLVGHVDVAFHSLLIGHLIDIAQEASEFDNLELQQEAERLREKLESSGE